MQRKDRIDAFGAAALVGFALLFAVNQVVIKLTNGGFQPVFLACLRSAVALVCLLLWMRLRGLPLAVAPGTLGPGLLAGVLFTAEFVCLFMALDLTTVARSSVIFYSMPVWTALGAHFLLPGDRLTPLRAAGLALAFAGVVWAILDRGGTGEGAGRPSLAGDLFALGGAVGWAAMALLVRASRLREVRPEVQLLWQVALSVPLLLLAATFFGPFLRDPGPLHVAGLLFQGIVVVTFGFIGWLWLLARYPASGVASFSFLTPVLGVLLGWALLGEELHPSTLGALALVATGLLLINRRPAPPAAAAAR